MLADAVVLSNNPFDPPERVVETDVEGTILDGELIYRSF
jgi:predicted amidohydrolase YtcJ